MNRAIAEPGSVVDPKRTVEVWRQTAGIRTARLIEVGDADPAEIECHRRYCCGWDHKRFFNVSVVSLYRTLRRLQHQRRPESTPGSDSSRMTTPMPGTTAREGSPPMPANAPDRALVWSGLHFRPPITNPPISRWRPAAALFVLLLHIALFGGLLLHRVQFPDAKKRRIEVIFTERVAEPALPSEESVAPPTLCPSSAPPVGDAQRKPAMQAVEVAPQELAPLRLHLTADPWQQPDTPPHHNPLARGPSARLPGRAEPFVEGVRFTQNTPEKLLRSIAIQYFGGVDPDPCPGARERLANLESNSDRYAVENDLRKVERYCRP